MLEQGRADSVPDSPIFATYLEARQAANRRRGQDGANEMITKVVRSPYGGYVVRSWPLDLLAEPELRDVTIFHGRPAYADV